MLKSACRYSSLALLPFSLLLFSCGTQQSSPHIAIPAGKQGVVHGGQQPVTGATIQLYAVGTTGDGSPSTPLLSPAPVTDSSGAFNISGAYTCPSPSSLVYIVATGGNPGLTPGTNNTAISMMAALGPCGSLSPSTFIFIDELTTVAAVYSLAPFMTSASAIGSAPADANELASAFTLAAQLVNPATGASPGTGIPTGTTVPVAQINTIGNILAACVNSPGGTAGDSSTCGMLFSLTTPSGITPATDTITATLHLANDPALNTTALYNLVPPFPPFQPMQPQQPPDFSVRLTYASGFTVSPAELDFPATRLGSTSTPLSFTFTNNTAAPVGIDIATLTYFGPTLSGANPEDFSLNFTTVPAVENCPTPVMPGATCTLQFVFRPTAAGARSAYITIVNTSANPVISLLITGQGLEAGAGPASLTPSSLPFTAAGTPANATLTNSGTLPLTIDSISIGNDPNSGQPAFSQTNNCGTSLAPQASCTIAVTALSTTQAYSTGVLTVADDNASGPQTSNLSYSNGFSGTVLNDFGSRSVGTQGSYGFNFVPPGLPQGFTLSLSGPNATDFSFSSSSSTQTSSCTTSRTSPFCVGFIYFTPSALGLRTATFNVNGTPYGGVIGVGLAAGVHFSTSVSAIDFRLIVIGQSATSSVNIVNTGTVPLTLNTPALSGANPSDFAATTTCATLAPNGTCSVTITATPTQPTNRFATLTLTDSTAAAQQTVSLRVLGLNPSPVANPQDVNFAYTPIGTTSSPQSFSVTSFNNDPITVQVTDSNISPFVITKGSSCSSTPCTVSLVFAPTAANTAPFDGNNAYGNILVTDLFSGQATLVSLSGIWQQTAP